MAIEPSRSTFPVSSRSTICSSSASADSKLMPLMSDRAGSLMLFVLVLDDDLERREIAHPVHKRQHVHAGGCPESPQIVTALEHGDEPPLGVPVCPFHEMEGHPDEIVLDEPQAAERVVPVGVEPRGDDDEI